MTFIDTNYFLRWLLDDVHIQHDEAIDLLKDIIKSKSKAITSTLVFFEANWVLNSFYKKDKPKLIKLLQKILELDFIIIEERQILKDSLTLFKKTSLNLPDCYNLCYARSKDTSEFKTFDKKLAKEFKRL